MGCKLGWDKTSKAKVSSMPLVNGQKVVGNGCSIISFNFFILLSYDTTLISFPLILGSMIFRVLSAFKIYFINSSRIFTAFVIFIIFPNIFQDPFLSAYPLNFVGFALHSRVTCVS